jgi:hypothetical protein
METERHSSTPFRFMSHVKINGAPSPINQGLKNIDAAPLILSSWLGIYGGAPLCTTLSDFSTNVFNSVGTIIAVSASSW